MNFKKKNAANAPAPNQAQQAARRRSLRSGAYASVLAVVVLVLVILLNLVVGAVPTKFTQFDISTGKMFTLSDTTKTMPPKYVRIITAIPILMINQVIFIPPEKATMAMASRYSMVPILEKCSNTNAIEL